MQVTTFGKIIMGRQRRVMKLMFAGVLLVTLTARLPVAGQQLPDEAMPPASETPEQLQQLVAPIALYPDALVAQILAASTYPTQVVEADRWLQQQPNLQGQQLARAVDKQSWDPSLKALTAFPSVLANLDKNLSWTEALGGAYFNQQQDVLDAIQVMRRRAEDAGNLRSSPQETVVTGGPTIVIQPVDPGVCYLPIYDPWLAYGAPLDVYPGYFYDSWYGPPFISFGPAIGIGFFNGFGWGWPAWGFNWDRRAVVFNHNPYISRSRYFFRSGPFIGTRGTVRPRRAVPSIKVNPGFHNRAGLAPSGRFGNGWANGGPRTPRANMGQRSGAFNGNYAGGTSRGPRSLGGVTSRGPGSLGGSSMGRASLSGRNSFGGGARGGGLHGGGSRGGGGSGRHR